MKDKTTDCGDQKIRSKNLYMTEPYMSPGLYITMLYITDLNLKRLP